ncbi:MAG: site-specific integrase, partial [Eubacteriales bacterium]|nr:site-specific integrase [Eubacteriales bacterium]
MQKKRAADLKRARNGAGAVHSLPNGKVRYVYMMPANPITGKPPYRTSVDGDTEEQARLKASKRIAAVSAGTYEKPNYMQLSVWLEKYVNEYMDGLKPNTKREYQNTIKRYLVPQMGRYRLFELNPSLIKGVYNKLQNRSARGGLSSKTIKNVHALLHSALDKAVFLGYLQKNPSDGISLPRVERRTMQVIQDEDIPRFLEAIKGHRFEALYFVDMFSGVRQGELLGMQWSDVDFQNGTITISKQLQRDREIGGQWRLVSLKTGHNGVRTLTVAPAVMDVLRHVKATQAQWRLTLGREWHNDMNLVFTNEYGGHLTGSAVYKALKKIVSSIGLDDIRFHDLRHSFALYALQNGDSLKEVQEAKGHTTITTTMDVYGHFSQQMKEASAERMNTFITS